MSAKRPLTLCNFNYFHERNSEVPISKKHVALDPNAKSFIPTDVGICTINSKSVNRNLDHPQKVGNTITMISSSFNNILNPRAKVFSFISTPNISLNPYARVFSYPQLYLIPA